VWLDADYPADPYPGAVPPGSFVHVDGVAHPLPDAGPGDLDAVLRRWGDGRLPVLAYGSNRCPSKITWLRLVHGLGPGPAVVLRARTAGVAAVWAAGLRVRDGQRPAVLAAAPDAVEEHAVWLATPDQVAALDRCEGRSRGGRHVLARLDAAAVMVAGVRIERPWAYLGAVPARRPLLVDGRPVRCGDVDQAAALALDGDTAPDDGLAATTEADAPAPDGWPSALFVYGTLRPGERAWWRLARHAAGPVRPATVAGRVVDTGRGYPAWCADGPGRAEGVVVPLRDPAAALPALDAYEGPEYARVRAVAVLDTGGATVCWAYAWRDGPLRP
jgi:gamma-glutamylcyclotransferase (GGCT)/AIG2-like uncharacterized protein YtfP